MSARRLNLSVYRGREERSSFPRHDGKGAEVVDAHRETRAGRQGEGENGSTYRLSGRLLRLALETMTTTKPPPRADGHAITPIKRVNNESVRATPEMAGGVSMAGLHNPRTHKQRDAGSRRFVVQEAGGTSARLVGMSQRGGR